MLAGRDRALVVVIAGLTLLALTLLAAGVNQLELKPGRALTLDSPGAGSAAELLSQVQLPTAMLGLLGSLLRIGVLVLLPFAIIHFIRSRSARKQVLLQLFYLLLFSIAILSLSRSFRPQPLDQPVLPVPQGSLPQTGPSFVPELPEPPRWLVTLLSGLGAGGLVWLAYRFYQRAQADADPAERIAADAQQALADIQAGHRLENVILRSYYQLCSASRRRGWSRAQNQTAREYGRDLRHAGIPAEALSELTGLFEKARYADAALDQDDERKAIGALRAILRRLGEL